ncbi:hypothetical protein [uncultured Clostridium sp.]|uniref:hypothetical protein n=1 Tax=uncultured Clostridium sp. TaxID=59620 RepID=UPI00262FF2AB|nr:hypothetical protein [uncultured Clostridium sp.]
MLRELESILNVAIAKRLTMSAKEQALREMRKLRFKHIADTDLHILENQIAILEQCI